MAASKRENESEDVLCKKRKSVLSDFLGWCSDKKLIMNTKVEVTRQGMSAGYGMVAVDDIAKDEVLFEIPRAILLTPETCHIADAIKKEEEILCDGGGWVPLLIALLHEYSSPTSQWKPYISIVPDFEELDMPIFWDSSTVQSELQGTGVSEAITRDLQLTEADFKNYVLPFIEKYPQYFSEECRDLEFYRQMVSFVMAYSFTEPETDDIDSDSDNEDSDMMSAASLPMMVPMADILNHVAKNNAHLDFGKQSLKMVATKNIAKGEEVYNTYGQLANFQLLHMYGFAEKPGANHSDIVEIPMSVVLEAAMLNISPEESENVKDKWDFLLSVGVIQEDGAFILGIDGLLNEDQVYQVLKVLSMSKDEFSEYEEKEGWSDDEDGAALDLNSGNFEAIRKLAAPWKSMLKRIVECRLSKYAHTLAEEKNLDAADLTLRQRYSHFVRLGQLNLLQQLLEACS